MSEFRQRCLGEQDPRKQGLKPVHNFSGHTLYLASESKIQENKDWNIEEHQRLAGGLMLGEQDPRKQGLKH